jgi:cell division septal protein FtsQ
MLESHRTKQKNSFTAPTEAIEGETKASEHLQKKSFSLTSMWLPLVGLVLCVSTLYIYTHLKITQFVRMELLEGLKQNNINHYCQRISKRKKKERKKERW